MGRAANYPIPYEDLGKNFTAAEKEAILAYIEEHRTCSFKEVTQAVLPGRRKSELRALVDKDSDFAADIRAARGYGDERIRDEMRRRAIEGVDEPVFQGGEQVGTVRRYSDPLLKTMASAYLEEYTDVRRLELSGPDGDAVRVEHKGTDVETLYHILRDGGAFEEVDGTAVEDAEAVGEIPAAREILPARPAQERQASGLPRLP